MFMRTSAHRQRVAEIRAGHQIVVQDQARLIAQLRAELAERQVVAVRGQRGRFVKREG